MSLWGCAWSPLRALIIKEFIQMRRDRMTFAMMIALPLMQLLLFGYAINTDPKALPTVIVAGDSGPVTRDLISALQTTGYFKITQIANAPAEADRLLTRGYVQFAITIPQDFERKYARGERPQILIEGDATDPSAISGAVSAANLAQNWLVDGATKGALTFAEGRPRGFEVVVHRRYNPENITQYNIVPGLIGVILSQTMMIITSIAVSRERERGTLEALLVMPLRPLEVMLGKIVPYIFVGYVQVAIVLVAARYVFQVPIQGSILLLSAMTIVFIAVNLAVGFLFSTRAKTQLQAVQMVFFFFLPSILLSGFMFPFRGMPQWAQWIGSALPLTHYLRIVRGIILKGSGIGDLYIHLLPMTGLLVVIVAGALLWYRRTLD